MSEVTRSEIIDIVAFFAERNPEYRAALLADPKGTLERQLNQVLPDSVKVKVLEETADTIYLLVPPPEPKSGYELTDAELERVAGGKGGKGGKSENNSRYTCNDAVGIATRIEIASLG